MEFRCIVSHQPFLSDCIHQRRWKWLLWLIDFHSKCWVLL